MDPTVDSSDDDFQEAPLTDNVLQIVQATSELRQNKLFLIRYYECGAVEPLKLRQ